MKPQNTTETAKHTPWTVGDSGIIYDDNANEVCSPMGETLEDVRANGERVCQAVNQHDQLIAQRDALLDIARIHRDALLRLARGMVRLRQPCDRCQESGKEPNNPKDACHSCGGMGEHCDAAELLEMARAAIALCEPKEKEARQGDDEPSHDDSVKCCPDCETPNQFGELCPRCISDRQAESKLDEPFD